MDQEKILQMVNKFRYINKLKTIYRSSSVEDRKESDAEHTFSCIMLADMLIDLVSVKINKLKVYDLLLYHDLLEIETGDIPLSPLQEEVEYKEDSTCLTKCAQKIPLPLKEKFIKNHNEFIERKTMESKFAKAIDALDPLIHELDYKKDWCGWSREFLIKKKSKYLEPFPELLELFHYCLDYMDQEGYFSEN